MLKNALVFFLLSFGLSANAIIGGVRQDVPSAVYIVNLECSGVLIAPNKILTAGHCVFDDPQAGLSAVSGRRLELNAFEGPAYNKGLQTFFVQVLSAVVHPTWESAIVKLKSSVDAAFDSKTVDLAVVTIDQNLPLRIAEFSPAGLFEDKQGLIAGSGCEFHGERTLDRTKVARVNFQRYGSHRIVIDAFDQNTKKPMGLCAGDSGGAMYAVDAKGNPELRVLGISSAGRENRITGRSYPYSVDLRIGSLQNWIRSVGNIPVTSVAENKAPESIDDDLYDFFVGSDEFVKRHMQQKAMGFALKDSRLSCYNERDSDRRYSSPVVMSFVSELTKSQNVGRKASAILSELIEKGVVKSCAQN